MQQMVGQNGFLTNLFGFSTIIPIILFLIFISRIVLKDWHLMDRQGRYLSYFFIHRKRDVKVLIALWVVGLCSLLTTAFLSTL